MKLIKNLKTLIIFLYYQQMMT